MELQTKDLPGWDRPRLLLQKPVKCPSLLQSLLLMCKHMLAWSVLYKPHNVVN